MKKLFAVLLAASASAFALPAAAASSTVDYTDIWYNAPADSESGWGVNIIQQNETMFVTLFVYGTDGSPRWYVGSNVTASSSTTYAGTLYAVTGSWFGGTWTPPSTAVAVGSINFSFANPTSGILSYNVNGVPVTKNIIRQTFRAENLGGNYIGGEVGRGASCPGGNLVNGLMKVTHNNSSITFFTDFVSNGQAARCNYAGTYQQSGSLGTITDGTFNCTVGTTPNARFGTFTVAEIKVARTGFSGTMTGSDQFCSYTGFFGGVRDVF